MSTLPRRAFRFRFPTHIEIRFLDETPQPGHIVSGGDARWVVRSVVSLRDSVLCNLLPLGDEPEVTELGCARIARPVEPVGPPATVGSARPPADPTATGALDHLPPAA